MNDEQAYEKGKDILAAADALADAVEALCGPHGANDWTYDNEQAMLASLAAYREARR